VANFDGFSILGAIGELRGEPLIRSAVECARCVRLLESIWAIGQERGVNVMFWGLGCDLRRSLSRQKNFHQSNSLPPSRTYIYTPHPLPGALFKSHKNNVKVKTNAVGREGVGRFTGLPLWTGWVDREAIRLLFFPLLLGSVFVFPGIAVGTQGFADCVYRAGGACYIVSLF
jgi:hypothetical protein